MTARWTRWLHRAALVALLCAGARAAPPIRIVTTTSDLGHLARHVGGDRVDVLALCAGYEDPHFLQAKPGFVLRARNADLWIRVGMDLEIGWEPPVLDGSRNRRIRPGQPGHLCASTCIHALDIPTGPLTRDMGDVHAAGNPHYWLDPWNGRRIAAGIADRLALLYPADAAYFQSNRLAFARELDEAMFGADLVARVDGDRLWALQEGGELEAFLHAEGLASALGGWVRALAPLKGKSIVTYHKSWVYFAHRFGLSVVAELEPKPGVPPTAAHLSSLEERMRREGIELILQEPFYSRRAADRVARNTGARVVLAASSVGATPEASGYLALFDRLAADLAPR